MPEPAHLARWDDFGDRRGDEVDVSGTRADRYEDDNGAGQQTEAVAVPATKARAKKLRVCEMCGVPNWHLRRQFAFHVHQHERGAPANDALSNPRDQIQVMYVHTLG